MSLLVNSMFSSEDVEVLRNALDTWCTERGVNIQSTEAQSAASAALDLHQSGYTDSEKLLTALRAHKGL